jgi:hypothetical protein
LMNKNGVVENIVVNFHFTLPGVAAGHPHGSGFGVIEVLERFMKPDQRHKVEVG